MDLNITEALKVLKKYYDYDSFRTVQADVIQSVLDGNDTLALLPTSAGKSVTFQIPALMFDGLTVVISPLIALQEDQVESLKRKGIPCGLLNSDMSITARRKVEKDITDNVIKILYVAPETLFTDACKELLKYKKISLIAVDEAHCFQGKYKVETDQGFKSFFELEQLQLDGLSDLVKIKSYNIKTREIEYKPLLNVFKNKSSIMVSFDLGKKGKLQLTRKHKVFTPLGEREAGTLKMGHQLYMDVDGKLELLRILSVSYPANCRIEGDYMYDIEVADNHNYFVQTISRRNWVTFNPTTILVHNCTSVFGDFRSKYLNLHEIRTLPNFNTCPVLAVTATADTRIIKDIETNIGLKENYKTFKTSFDRPLINYHVQLKNHNPIKQITDLIKLNGRNSCGIIYCMTKAATEQLSNTLNTLGYNSLAYHATIKNPGDVLDTKGKKLSLKNYKKYILEQFVTEKVNIVCATIAFGMGIDHPNIKWVVHYDTPQNLENYSQECGRASRGGHPGSAYLLYDPSSYNKSIWLMSQTTKAKTSLDVKMNKLKQMHNFVKSRKCRRHQILQYFGEDSPTFCGKCDNCGAELLNKGESNEN